MGIGTALRLGHRDSTDTMSLFEQRLRDNCFFCSWRSVHGRGSRRCRYQAPGSPNTTGARRHAPEKLVHQRKLHLAVAPGRQVRASRWQDQELALADLGLQRAYQFVAIGIADIVGRLQLERLDFLAHELIESSRVPFETPVRFRNRGSVALLPSVEMVGGAASTGARMRPLALPIARLPQPGVFLKGWAPAEQWPRAQTLLILAPAAGGRANPEVNDRNPASA